MRSRTILLLVLFALTAAGAWWRLLGLGSDVLFSEPSFLIVNGSSKTAHRLHGDETIQSALAVVPDADAHKTAETLVLIRRGPDGVTQQLVDCEAGCQLVDPAKDQKLRNGDQLIVATPEPAGLERPPRVGQP